MVGVSLEVGHSRAHVVEAVIFRLLEGQVSYQGTPKGLAAQFLHSRSEYLEVRTLPLRI